MDLYNLILSLKVKKISPAKTFSDCVKERLKNSENLYMDTINNNCIYILSRSNYKVMKALERHQKHKEENNNGEKTEFGFIESI